MKVTFDLNDVDFFDKVFCKILKERIEQFEGHVSDYKNGTYDFIPIFSTDPEEDLKRIKKQLKAFKRTYMWFGGDLYDSEE